ncbi:HIT family protein [Patescibacteria group bacterium]|nr:HIT family protein [Patescibacteria group bacterium]
MSDTTCLFCRIAKGEIPAAKVYEDEIVLAFMDVHPVTQGHLLVVPKRHSVDLRDTDPVVLGQLLPRIQRIAHGLCQALGIEGFNLEQNNGKVAGQVIPHLHFHLIPRRSDDGLKHWPALAIEPTAEERAALAVQIRAAIQPTVQAI